MKCVILQPSYIPWRGYFHQIQKADVFVFYDDAQYDRSGWRNRNQIKTKDGLKWLTIPVHRKGAVTDGIPINQIRIDWSRPWAKRHWESIRHAYGRAPHFDDYREMLEVLYSRRSELLVDFVVDTTIALAQRLGITKTQFIRSSTLPAQGHKTDRVISILKLLDADYYISGPSAKSYLEMEKFGDIPVEFMDYDYPPYPQLYGDFAGNVSVLDLMFMAGQNAGRLIWQPEGEQ